MNFYTQIVYMQLKIYNIALNLSQVQDKYYATSKGMCKPVYIYNTTYSPYFSILTDDDSYPGHETVKGTNATFTVTGVDPDGDQYKLVVCNGTTTNYTLQYCTVNGNVFCKSKLTDNSTETDCILDTISLTVGTHPWISFLVDNNSYMSLYNDTYSPLYVYVPTPTPPTPTPTPTVKSDFTGDMPSDYDVGQYEQQSGKDTGVMKGSIVYLIIIIMALAGLYIFFAAVLVISTKARETYKIVK